VATRLDYVWRERSVELAWNDGSREDTASREVAWDPRRTSVTGFDVEIAVRANGRTNVDLYLNAALLQHFHWEIWEDLAPKRWRGDALGSLQNGTNIFKIVFYKDILHPVGVTATYTVTSTLTYEGSPPTVQPEWEKYLIPAIAITSLGAAIAILGRRRKP